MSKGVEIIGGVQVSVETGTALVVGVEPKARNVEIKLDDPVLRGKLRFPLKGWLDKADTEALALAERANGTATMVRYRIESHRDAKVDPAMPIADVPQTSRFRRLVSLVEDVASVARVEDVASVASVAPEPAPWDDLPEPGTPVPTQPPPRDDSHDTKPWTRFDGDGRLNLGSYAAQAAAGMIDVAVEALQAAGVGAPTVAQVKALAARLLAVADAAQAAATGRPVDRMAASHTRARGLLRTALTVHPAPVGATAEARQQWQADLTAYATGLLELVPELDAHRMPVIVGAATSAPASRGSATGTLATEAERQAAISAARRADDTEASRSANGETDRNRLEAFMRANGIPPLISPALTSEQALRVRAYLANVDGAEASAA